MANTNKSWMSGQTGLTMPKRPDFERARMGISSDTSGDNLIPGHSHASSLTSAEVGRTRAKTGPGNNATGSEVIPMPDFTERLSPNYREHRGKCTSWTSGHSFNVAGKQRDGTKESGHAHSRTPEEPTTNNQYIFTTEHGIQPRESLRNDKVAVRDRPADKKEESEDVRGGSDDEVLIYKGRKGKGV